MKVDVLQANDVKIKPWRWYSDWIDIAVFDCGTEGFLLQMKISRFNGKVFKSTALKSWWGMSHPACQQVGDLTQMQKAT